MAQKVLVEMVDDIDGGEASETVTFGLDGVQYEIDLSDGNASSLREEFARYVAASRRSGGRKARTVAGSQPPTAADRERSRAVRAWALENGWDVSERGRIPANVLTAYDERDAEPVKTPRKRGAKKA
ncbi:Lsr2 family protein [Amycolatopsis sp. PS_44_ISF1]|uniref:histone-like nucleoid-structuring protein Lsr2 n=1 Tax=Amycolatopsis sp. PS_44_ISF1 TaxID=2974917 RepID=UPI0028DED23E|nr:Lsr2 family protein [Amycolatopsis sp. PS_44_ISF1]MDT8913534.1 Lsr2 family protein [Amycolatopsis sp. PS_44_ISF1]